MISIGKTLHCPRYGDKLILGRSTREETLAHYRSTLENRFKHKIETREAPSVRRVGSLGVCKPANARRSRGAAATSHPSSVHHLRYNADMDLGDSFSKLKKKVKHRLAGKKHKPGGGEAGTDGEIVDASSSLPQPEPHVVATDEDGSGANADGRQACSTDPPPQPDEPGPVPAGGSETDQGEAGADVGGREVSKSYPHPRLDIGAAMGSESGRGDDGGGKEGGWKTNGVWTWLFQLLPLIVLPDDGDGSAVLGDIPEIPHPDKSTEPSATMDGTTSDGRSLPSATAKLLCGVRDSKNGFDPLKSLAGSLCLILENCKVWLPSHAFNPQCLCPASKQGWMNRV